MKRLLLVPALWVALALPAAAEKLSLNQISNYLNRLGTAKGSFTQINDDGTISTGTIFLKRPGKARFEYNPPDRALVLVYAGAVAIFDTKLKAQPEQYPLSRTPLKLVLDQNINLGREKMVIGHSYDGTATSVVAQDPKNPEYGTIQLVFTSDPVELRQWVITDDSGSNTTVILGALEKDGQISNSVFNIERQIKEFEK
jgi:outer membrane lipoprotein-sorting protein